MSSTISRVLYSMTIYLDHTLPYDSLRLLPNEDATYLKARRAAVSPSSALRQNIWSCFRWGLHSPFCYQKGGSLLHCPSTLTIIRWRFLFCCTILRVASTGRYPARCPVKPGLSSALYAMRSSVLLHTAHFIMKKSSCKAAFLYFVRKK